MRDLRETISERLLPYVSQPVQYVGLEINARRKDVASAKVAVVLAFPDAYTIGISHLGSEILYKMLNDTDGVACDRTYCPRPDADKIMHDRDIPLFAWESRFAVRDFDILGFSLSYECCVTNVLTMLDLAGIALRSADRQQDDPLVIAGDALADTPECMAPFIDLFVVGDGEAPLAELVELVRRAKSSGLSRQDMLLEAARTLPSIYVPAAYEPSDENVGLLRPVFDGVEKVIHRAKLRSLSDSPAITAPLVPLAEAVHNRVAIEIMRGCPNACRFCQAGATRLPVRTRSVDEICRIAREALAKTGYSEISLLSLSSSDHPKLGELIDRLNAEFSQEHVSISLPSLRVDSQLQHLPKLTSTVRKAGLTIAAEAGSERLRRAIGKRITEQDMLDGVTAAWQAGWRRVKVYFMAGLPGETDTDIDAIFHLCHKLSETARDVLGRPGNISASVSWFIPKPHTPMQWCPMKPAEYYFAVRRRLKDLSRRSAVNFKFHHIERSILECAIARGDRRTGDVIEAAWRAGARMDAWREHFDYDKWLAAFARFELDPAECAQRTIPLDEPTAWSHIVGPRGKDFLLAEYQRMHDILGG